MSQDRLGHRIDHLREQVIDQLIVNYGHEALSLEEFESRLDKALVSDNRLELKELVSDLEIQADNSYAEQKREALELDLEYDYGAAEDVEYAVNVFGGSNRSGEWTVPKEIRMFNLFGGGEIDFTDAKFTHPSVRIKLFTLFGGATIYVREDINAVSKIISIFGGTDNSAPSNPGRRGPVVVVHGFVMFGGTSIKIKRTIKEMFVDFANRFRGVQQPRARRSSRNGDVTPLFEDANR